MGEKLRLGPRRQLWRQRRKPPSGVFYQRFVVGKRGIGSTIFDFLFGAALPAPLVIRLLLTPVDKEPSNVGIVAFIPILFLLAWLALGEYCPFLGLVRAILFAAIAFLLLPLPFCLVLLGFAPWLALALGSCICCMIFVYWRCAQSISKLERKRARHSEEHQ